MMNLQMFAVFSGVTESSHQNHASEGGKIIDLMIEFRSKWEN